MNIKSTIWRYYAFCFLKDFGLFSAVLIPFYTQWGGVSIAWAQILQAWFSLWIFFLEVPTGAIADYLGRKYSLALGALVVGMATLVYGSIPNLYIFFLAEFVFAVGIALISGADDALLYDALVDAGKEHEASRYVGKAYSFHMLGIFLAAPLGGLLASKYGLNAPMLLSSIPYFLACLIAFSIKEPQVHQKTTESKRYVEVLTEGFVYFKNHSVLRKMALDAIVVSVAAYFVIWLNQAVLLKLNIPVSYFGFTQALLVGTEILIAANFKRLELLFGSTKRYLQFTALITGVSFLTVAIVPHIATVLILIVFAGGFGLTRLRLMMTYMNQHIMSAKRATVLSSISMFQRLALAGANPLVGMMTAKSLQLSLFLIGLLPLTIFLFSPVKNSMFIQEKVKSE